MVVEPFCSWYNAIMKEQSLVTAKISNLSGYEKIALDIAHRIVRGELAEGSRLSGRSVMSSEYGVSPETIRRAFSLLEEIGVVKVRPNSGVSVESSLCAQKYIDRHGNRDLTRDLQDRMRALIDENEKLGRQLNTTMRELIAATERFSASNPFHTYECTIQASSVLVDNTLGSIRFWQKTGATVIAIRRDGAILLSPGPELILRLQDILVLVGSISSRDKVLELTS